MKIRPKTPIVLIRGAGDMATGVAARLLRANVQIVMTELSHPFAVRRSVSFGSAVYSSQMDVEGYRATRVESPNDIALIFGLLEQGQTPVVIDPDFLLAHVPNLTIVVDARMSKRSPEKIAGSPSTIIDLGPGFIAGYNCHVVVETQRGLTLGRVYYRGSPSPDSGQPDGDPALILRATQEGTFHTFAQIGDWLEINQSVAEIIPIGRSPTDTAPILIFAPMQGLLRGLLHTGLPVTNGLKVGDIDSRNHPRLCSLVSDKGLAIGGGVSEAILSQPEHRNFLWN